MKKTSQFLYQAYPFLMFLMFCCLPFSTTQAQKRQKKLSPTAQSMAKQGFVNVLDYDSTIHVSLMYSRPDNFTGRVLYSDLREAYLHPMAAKALAQRTAPDAFRYLPSAEKWLRNRGWLENPEAAKDTRTNNVFLQMYEDEYGGGGQ